MKTLKQMLRLLWRKVARCRVFGIDGILISILLLLVGANLLVLSGQRRAKTLDVHDLQHNNVEPNNLQPSDPQPNDSPKLNQPPFQAQKKPIVRDPAPRRALKNFDDVAPDDLKPTKKLLELQKGRTVVNLANVKFVPPEKVSVEDYRREACVQNEQNNKYDLYGNVSLIIDAEVDNIHYLAVTVLSALHTTTDEYVKQIIVIVDGSVSEFLYRKARSLLFGVPSIQFVRHAKKGQMEVRSHAAKMARENVFVFVESGVWFSKGWLEPILDTLKSHPKSIVMPLYDSVLYEVPGTTNSTSSSEPNPVYKKAPFERAPVILWSMQTAFHPALEQQQRLRTYETPVVRHDAWAVRKDHFAAIGDFDMNVNDPGAGHIELSLNQWRCHGPVRIVRCSRVAIRDANDVSAGTVPFLEYIVSKWLKQKTTPISLALGRVTIPYFRYEAPPTCLKTDKQFADKVNTFVPPAITNPDAYEPIESGRLKSGHDDCVHIGLDASPFLNDCKTAPEFKLMKNGLIYHVQSERCLHNGMNYQELTVCIDDIPAQQWVYEDGRIKNVGSLRCLMQMTDKRQKPLQITYAHVCETIEKKNELFAKWTFI